MADRRFITLRTYRGEPVPYPERKGNPYSVRWCQQNTKAIHAAHTKYGMPCTFTQQQIHEAHEQLGNEWHLGVAYPALHNTPIMPKERMPDLLNDEQILRDMCISYRSGMCMWQPESAQGALFPAGAA